MSQCPGRQKKCGERRSAMKAEPEEEKNLSGYDGELEGVVGSVGGGSSRSTRNGIRC